MTPDIAAIRAALAVYAATTFDDYTPARALERNAPTWLAALCDEIDLLRNTLKTANFAYIRLEMKRDAALAENERLRTEKYLPASLYKQIMAERDAWRACADQLSAGATNPDRIVGAAELEQALAVCERLKAGE